MNVNLKKFLEKYHNFYIASHQFNPPYDEIIDQYCLWGQEKCEGTIDWGFRFYFTSPFPTYKKCKNFLIKRYGKEKVDLLKIRNECQNLKIV